MKWSKVLEDGLVFNAMDGAKKLGISPDELGKKYDALKKGETIIKFGGGFYCGKVDDIYAARTLKRSQYCIFMHFPFCFVSLVLLELVSIEYQNRVMVFGGVRRLET